MRWFLALLLVGCATPLTDFEREVRFAETYEKWVLCREIYYQSGAIWWSDWRVSRRIERGMDKPEYFDMVADLSRNSCNQILRPYGYE